MCKKLVLVTVLGLLTSVAGANTWKIDFQGDENHGGTYNQTDPVDMTEPGVYWNIFEVPALFEPWNPPLYKTLVGYSPLGDAVTLMLKYLKTKRLGLRAWRGPTESRGFYNM